MQLRSVAFILAAALVQPALAADTAPASKPFFTVAKETTAITAPLRPDGTPDYVAALNEKYSKGVTPENNALLQMLQIRGESLLAPESRDKILELTGARLPPDGMPVFQSSSEYVMNGGTTLTEQDLATRMSAIGRKWPPADEDGEVAKYVHSQDRFLDLAVEASRQTQFFCPFVSKAGTLADATAFRYVGLMDLARCWNARVMVRAGSGDIDGAISDALAIKRLARLFPQQGTLLGVLIGQAYSDLANDSLGTITASGKLTEAQCQTLAKGLAMPPISMVEAFDTSERWLGLDVLVTLAAGRTAAVVPLTIFEKAALANWSAADWDVALKFYNTEYDREMAILKDASIDQLTRSAADFKLEQDKWRLEKVVLWSPNEAPDHFAQRFIHGLLARQDIRRLTSTEINTRQKSLRDAMLHVLVAAAQSKAHTGQWPESLETFVPGTLKDLPVDIYSIDAKTPVSYRNAGGHVRVFSVGTDHTPLTSDDLFVGDATDPAP